MSMFVVFMLLATSVLAVPIVPFNPRPQPIGTPTASEKSFQFIFYLESNPFKVVERTSWSVDQLNNGDSRFSVYRDMSDDNKWILAFEDVPISGGADGDNNDMVVTAESIVRVSEPGTLLLLGSGLVGLAGWGRKKFRK